MNEGLKKIEVSSFPGAPKSKKEEDSLQRWRFARGVYDLIKSSPLDWPLRIGIYGGWGSGKTTVLKFIEKIALEDGAKVTWFNPWAHQDLKAIWWALARSIDAGVQGNEFFTATKVKGGVTRFLGVGKKAAEFNPISKAIAGALDELGISSLVEVKKKDLTKLLETKLGNSRLIVMVDDLDRADPKQLSGIFYLLREVLDIPRCAFIFGMDPEIVAKALGGVNEGWAEGAAFLEKIIDFPMWLSEPQHEDLWSLILHELNNAKIQVDLSSLKDIFDILPRNPRKLTQIIRGLRQFKTILERHDEGELHWTTLLFCHILQAEFPGSLRAILSSEEALHWITRGWLDKSSQAAKLKPDDDGTKIFATYFRIKNLNETEKERFLFIVRAWKERSSLVDSDQLKYYASLFDEPPVLTGKEFSSFYKAFEESSKRAEIVTKFLEEHAKQIGCSRREVFKDLFTFGVKYRLSLLNEAADSTLKSDLTKAVTQSTLALRLLEILGIEFKGFTGDDPLLNFDSFVLLHGMVARWAHFRRPEEYVQTRDAEQKLLLDVVANAESMSDKILERVAPWSNYQYEADDHWKNYIEPLNKKISAILEPKLAKEVLGRFVRSDGIAALRGEKHHIIERYILFSVQGPLYTKENLGVLSEFAKEAAHSDDIQKNFSTFLSMIAYGLTRGYSPVGPDEVGKLVKNLEIIRILWKGAVAKEIQFRMIGSLLIDLNIFRRAHPEETFLIPEWLAEHEKTANKQDLVAANPEPVK